MSPLDRAAPAPFRILSDEDRDQIAVLRGRYPDPQSAIMPALWILQEREGLLTADGMREVARAMDLAPAKVEAVASFYSMYFFKPHGRYLVEMCTSMSCLLCGSGKVMSRLQQKLGIRAGETTPDDLVTLLEVECIGACGGAPAAQVNHAFFENLDDAAVDALVDDIVNSRLEVHRVQTGRLQAAEQELVNLRDPGANRIPLPADGAAGPVVDLLKGRPTLLSDEDLPAQYVGRR
ncbi:MAG: NADH-quinone oxidoreductase subunit NuoE family protein [Candidatus Dormibacteria bacterium]